MSEHTHYERTTNNMNEHIAWTNQNKMNDQQKMNEHKKMSEH